MIEVDNRLWPEPMANFLPRHQLTGPFEQHRQQLEGLFLQPQAFALLRELAVSKIDFENPEP